MDIGNVVTRPCGGTAIVADITGNLVLLNYVEGGNGWWPLVSVESFPKVVLGDMNAAERCVCEDARGKVIDAMRDKDISAGYLHADGHTYYADLVFQSHLQGLILAWQTGVLDPAATVIIRRKHSGLAQMGQSDVVTLAAGLMIWLQRVYMISWQQKDGA